MALDVYVMPLWRFKAGDFQSPIEKVTGIKPEIISLATPELQEPPWYLRWLESIGLIEFSGGAGDRETRDARWSAKREVSGLKRKVSRLAKANVDWLDEGAVQYARQFHGTSCLRAFAVWHDHFAEIPEFLEAPDGDFYKHPAWLQPRVSRPRFPLLTAHSLYSGYFFPTSFDGCHNVEPFKVLGKWKFYNNVASTYGVTEELRDLLASVEKLLETAGLEYAQLLRNVNCYAQELAKICDLSIEHQLPVIFYG
jgi:hypothetical protein